MCGCFLLLLLSMCIFFFFNDPAPPEIHPLPLHAPLPSPPPSGRRRRPAAPATPRGCTPAARTARPPRGARCSTAPRASARDRKSTRLNSSHANISYAVFCLKKKKKITQYSAIDSDHDLHI